MGDFTAWQWLLLVQHELLLFAGIFFLIGAVDELAVDFAWAWCRLSGKADTQYLHENPDPASLTGTAAVFIPAWDEANVIGTTIGHALDNWPHAELRIYVGCYCNDPATISAVMEAAKGDRRVKLVVHGRKGPSTKADCLNRLYRALRYDEELSGQPAHMIVLHDAEDMVDPAGLALLDRAIRGADLAQLPVLPVPQAHAPWISGHYCEEFAEAHGKTMVLRDALGVGMPLAGVGCAIRRSTLDFLAARNPDNMPFSADCLTEDYELGLGVAEIGGTARFVRARHSDGQLVATRACFPDKLEQAVRQKTRWTHGIAFQGWDRLGWCGTFGEFWMRMRDRKGPFTAFTLAAAYVLLVLSVAAWGLQMAGFGELPPIPRELRLVLGLNLCSLIWRAVWRFLFTAREYGTVEGLFAILRIPVTNIIAIMAGRRALFAYIDTLGGKEAYWDKTTHRAHPATIASSKALA